MARNRNRDFDRLSEEHQQQVIAECLKIGVTIERRETPDRCENCDEEPAWWHHGLTGHWPFVYCGLCVGERVVFPRDLIGIPVYKAPETARAEAQAEAERLSSIERRIQDLYKE